MTGPAQEQVAPYMAVGLSTVVHGIGSRRDIERNLQIVEDGIHAAVSIIGINLPVRLVALAEGALTGFTDEIFDIPHVTAARDLFIDIPGPETERLAALARQYDTYIVAQSKARWPEAAVAHAAGVSRTWLYRQDQIRDLISRQRALEPPAAQITAQRVTTDSLRARLDAAREEITRLRTENRSLRDQLARSACSAPRTAATHPPSPDHHRTHPATTAKTCPRRRNGRLPGTIREHFR